MSKDKKKKNKEAAPSTPNDVFKRGNRLSKSDAGDLSVREAAMHRAAKKAKKGKQSDSAPIPKKPKGLKVKKGKKGKKK